MEIRQDDNDSNDSRLRIIDTSNGLTKEELFELKRLANLSKVTRLILGIVFGIIGVIGLPQAWEWLVKHFGT